MTVFILFELNSQKLLAICHYMSLAVISQLLWISIDHQTDFVCLQQEV
ncbi:MAG TPA: hypothetical protein VFB12_12300 [Ktedonobacteraceae bacterium]|nr:hypothetical protein [Ktedonobacteraceae bacterium]